MNLTEPRQRSVTAQPACRRRLQLLGVLILLGADGRIVGRAQEMGATDPAFLT